MNEIKTISDFHKSQVGVIMGTFKTPEPVENFNPLNYDAIQPDRDEPEPDPDQVEAEQVRDDIAHKHAMV